nr:hypothetical protein [Tanacetum cinerariifolium]
YMRLQEHSLRREKKPKSKKTPTEDQVTPPTGPTRGSEHSYSVFSGNPDDKGFAYTVSIKGIVKTMSLPEGPHGDKDSEELKPPADIEPLTNLVVDPSGTDANDNEEVFTAGEEMDKDIPPTDEEARSPPPNKEQLESSHAQESDSNSSCPDALRKYDNILLLTERQLDTVKKMLIIGTKLTSLFRQPWIVLTKNSTKRADLLKPLNGVTETIKVVQEDVKDDPALNRKVIEATEAYTKNSTTLNELLTLIKNFDFQGENDNMQIEDKTRKEQEPKRPTIALLISVFRPLMRTNLKVEMMTSPLTIKLTDIVLKIPTPNSDAEIDSQATKRINKGNKIATDDVEPLEKLVPASKVVREDPDEPVKVPYIINGKMHYLTNDEINAHTEKKDMIKKAAKEAKMFKKTKTEVIKVVQEEA